MLNSEKSVTGFISSLLLGFFLLTSSSLQAAELTIYKQTAKAPMKQV